VSFSPILAYIGAAVAEIGGGPVGAGIVLFGPRYATS
jgi:hypothetical protein